MTIKNADLPAFPNEIYPKFVDDFMNGFRAGLNPTGITKREFFVAMALSGMAHGYSDAKQAAERAIEFADETLKQLDK